MTCQVDDRSTGFHCCWISNGDICCWRSSGSFCLLPEKQGFLCGESKGITDLRLLYAFRVPQVGNYGTHVMWQYPGWVWDWNMAMQNSCSQPEVILYVVNAGTYFLEAWVLWGNQLLMICILLIVSFPITRYTK